MTPTMEHGEEADLGAEVLGIGGNGLQGFGGGPEQNAIDYFFVLIGDRGNLFRQRKDDVKVLGVKKFGATIFKPFRAGERLAFWAMAIGAGVVSVALMAAAVALLEMTTENGGPADLDRMHDAALRDG